MTDYHAPIADISFAFDLVGLDSVLANEPYAALDRRAVDDVIAEFGRLMDDVWAPTNRLGDEIGATIDGDEVHLPRELIDAFHAYVEAGWPSVPFDPAYGGGGFPWVIGIAMQELLNSANLSLAMAPLLTQGAIDALSHHGSETQRETYLANMIQGTWTATMNLTEADAGSDVGALRTRAVRAEDGSYRITGQKIFISFGEHPLTDNIIHFVLARTPDAPAGTKGISFFIVPKFLVNPDGSLGERNDVHVVSIEHKMGIRSSPTCVLAYGERGEGAVGYLVGEENTGMRTMFTMMNNARLGVAVQGLGLAERALQAAIAYANERHQGYAPGAARGEKSLIVDHPDVRRMLLGMRATTEAMRALCYEVATNIDIARYAADEAACLAAQEYVDLCIPLVKSWCTDEAERVTSTAIQVYGGMGYMEETGVAHLYRDAKITQIYEGTNGIQAMDLVGRKLPMRAGGVFTDHLARMRSVADELAAADGEVASLAAPLRSAIDTAERTVGALMVAGASDPVTALAGATPLQRMLALVTAGSLMGRQALLAQRSGDEQKLVSASFFLTHLLGEVHGLESSVTGGAAELRAARFEPTV